MINEMKKLDKQAEIFKALSDKSRLRILKMLQKKSLCVCEITEILQLATSTVSNHLSILKETGLIIDEKDKKWINYRIVANPSEPAVASAFCGLSIKSKAPSFKASNIFGFARSNELNKIIGSGKSFINS